MTKEPSQKQRKKIKVQKGKDRNKTLLTLFMCAAITGCATNLQNLSKTDCSESSSLNFEQFQIESQHPARSTEAIWSKVNTNQLQIANVLDGHRHKFPNKDRIESYIGVNANGEFFMTFLHDTIRDTSFNDGIKNVCKLMKLDSLPNYNVVSKIKITIDDMNRIELVDSVRYYQNRTKKSILCVVMKNLEEMRYAYNRHLRAGGNFSGKITVKFAIDEHGKIIRAEIIEKTLNNRSFEEEELSLIRSWKFPEINNPKDVTEVIFPFIFNQ